MGPREGNELSPRGPCLSFHRHLGDRRGAVVSDYKPPRPEVCPPRHRGAGWPQCGSDCREIGIRPEKSTGPCVGAAARRPRLAPGQQGPGQAALRSRSRRFPFHTDPWFQASCVIVDRVSGFATRRQWQEGSVHGRECPFICTVAPGTAWLWSGLPSVWPVPQGAAREGQLQPPSQRPEAGGAPPTPTFTTSPVACPICPLARTQ